jgi:hypothetical protein
VSSPPFPLLRMSVVPSTGVEAPRNFMAPNTCGELSCQAGTRNKHRPALLCPDLELRQGLVFPCSLALTYNDDLAPPPPCRASRRDDTAPSALLRRLGSYLSHLKMTFTFIAPLGFPPISQCKLVDCPDEPGSLGQSAFRCSVRPTTGQDA